MPNCRFEKEVINDKNSAIAFLYKVLADEYYREDVKQAILNIEKSDEYEIAKAKFDEAAKK